MKTIFQLAKAARRINRRILHHRRRAADAADIGGYNFHEKKLSQWTEAREMLNVMLQHRRVGMPPLRSCVPHKKRRTQPQL